MAGIFTRGALDKIINNADLTPEQRTEQIFSLYGRALDEGFISKNAAEEAKQAAVEAAKAGFKVPDPIDPKTTKEFLDLQAERDMLRAIGGDDFQNVKPKFREQVFGMLKRGEDAKPIGEQLSSIREKYDEYFVTDEQPPKPTFGSPDKGKMPTGEQGDSAKISDIWGFAPKKN
jgi:hypothetical protein